MQLTHIMLKSKYLLLIIIFFAGLAGCATKTSAPKQLDCKIPEQNCMPGKWDGMVMDTSVEVSKLLDFHYRIEPVHQINSPDDEWSFSFISKKLVALTFSDRDIHRMMIARRINDARFSIESGIYLPRYGHAGNLSVRDGKAVFATQAEEEEKRGELEDFEQDTASATLNEDDEEIIPVPLPNPELIGNIDIFQADYADKKLTNLRSLGQNIHNNIFTWESQPALSPDGDVVFFASDREGSYGGTDIWFSVRLDNFRWSDPVNAGTRINTNCDELTPFVTYDGKQLLIASNGGKTVGGYDLFQLDIDPMFWEAVKKDLNEIDPDMFFSERKNLRAPLNTEHDEIFPSTPVGIDSLIYYSSNQLAGQTSLIVRRGGFDIFVRYKVPSPYIVETKKREEKDIGFAFDDPDLKEDEPEIEISPFYQLTGTVYNETTLEPVENADITVRELPSRRITKQTTTGAAGTYQVDLEKDKEFEVTAQGKDLFYDSFKMRAEKDDPVETVRKDVYLPVKLQLRINFPLDNFTDPYKYTLDSNGVETNITWREELDLLAENIKKSLDKIIKINLSGHTDYLGSEAYNDRLGQKRVDFVVEELIKRGVPEDILDARSAGENEPLPRWEEENEKMYRKRLRRVTLEKVLKNI